MRHWKLKLIILIILIFISAVFIQLIRTDEVFNYTSWFSASQKPLSTGKSKLRRKYSAEKPEDYQKALVLYSSSDVSSLAIYRNTYQVYRTAGINAEYVEINSRKAVEKISELEKDRLVVVATERMDFFNEPDIFKSFIKRGGRVVFLTRFYQKEFDEVVGIKENRGFFDRDIQGFQSSKAFFPGLDEIEFRGNLKISNSMLDVDLEDRVKLLATAERKPLVWTNEYGRGKILYINSSLLEDKVNRGLLIQYTSYLPESFLMTIINAKVFDIDDFPAPIRPGKTDVIYNEYGLNNKDFLYQVWWPDMKKLAQKYNLKYTGLIIGSYNSETTPPFSRINHNFYEKYFAKNLVDFGGELGIHGYNHYPLVVDEKTYSKTKLYDKVWKSQTAMEKALKKLKRSIEEDTGEIKLRSYVPPSNILSKEGKRALKNIFPELKVIASLYTGDEEDGALIQEIGVDPVFEDVYNLPRFSYDYHYNKDIMWDIYNALAQYGFFHHFVHPDDIMDRTRSRGKNWKQLLSGLENIVSDTDERFPFLQKMGLSEVCEYYKNIEDLNYFYQDQSSFIKIYYQQAVFPVYQYLRIRGRKVEAVDGGELQLIGNYGDNRLYMLTAKSNKVNIELKEIKFKLEG